MRKALWREGIRYRIHYRALPGKPDIAITKYKIAIFCDGEFWHGKNWIDRKESIKTNSSYWIQKIERNIAKDNEIEKKLDKLGWTVLRYWGKEINKNLNDCINEIKDTIIEIQCGAYKDVCYSETDSLAAECQPEYNTDDGR